MAWVLVVIAGLLEAGWAIGLKYAEGFTRPLPSIVTIIGIIKQINLDLIATICRRHIAV
ncbi:MAG: SMR family transporter [Planctomycetaceae bacterium]